MFVRRARSRRRRVESMRRNISQVIGTVAAAATEESYGNGNDFRYKTTKPSLYKTGRAIGYE